jgi:hypothetical protein
MLISSLKDVEGTVVKEEFLFLVLTCFMHPEMYMQLLWSLALEWSCFFSFWSLPGVWQQQCLHQQHHR